MVIYTSYFGNMSKIQKMQKPLTIIAICGKSPDWYNGLEYKKLAPKWEFFKKWKETHDNEYYIRCFKEQVLDKLDPKQVLHELCDMIPANTEPVLLCYEKPEDFCHRHLVAKWFREAGIHCQEIIPQLCTSSCEAMYLDND